MSKSIVAQLREAASKNEEGVVRKILNANVKVFNILPESGQFKAIRAVWKGAPIHVTGYGRDISNGSITFNVISAIELNAAAIVVQDTAVPSRGPSYIHRAVALPNEIEDPSTDDKDYVIADWAKEKKPEGFFHILYCPEKVIEDSFQSSQFPTYGLSLMGKFIGVSKGGNPLLKVRFVNGHGLQTPTTFELSQFYYSIEPIDESAIKYTAVFDYMSPKPTAEIYSNLKSDMTVMGPNYDTLSDVLSAVYLAYINARSFKNKNLQGVVDNWGTGVGGDIPPEYDIPIPTAKTPPVVTSPTQTPQEATANALRRMFDTDKPNFYKTLLVYAMGGLGYKKDDIQSQTKIILDGIAEEMQSGSGVSSVPGIDSDDITSLIDTELELEKKAKDANSMYLQTKETRYKTELDEAQKNIDRIRNIIKQTVSARIRQ